MIQKIALGGALLLLVVLLFGCTGTTSSATATEQKFTSLRETFNATNAYPVNTQQLSEYITGLSLLRKEGSASLQKIIDTELFSAQGFSYLLAAMNAQGAITNRASCTSTEGKQFTTSAKLAVLYSSKAVTAASGLNDAELAQLRVQQKEMAQNYLSQSQAIVTSIEVVCGKS